MSQDPPREIPKDNPEPQEKVQDSMAPVQEVEQQLEPVIKDLPEPQQQQIMKTVERAFMGIIQQSGAPKLDPETAKILAASVDKDNELKFTYLTQKENHEAAESLRNHEREKMRWQDQVKLFKPILYTALLVIPACLFIGIWLAATGHEMLGSNLITAVLTGLLAFLGGLGAMHFFKDK